MSNETPSKVENDDSAQAIPLDAFPAGVTPRVGQELRVDEDGEAVSLWVTAVFRDHVRATLERPGGSDDAVPSEARTEPTDEEE